MRHQFFASLLAFAILLSAKDNDKPKPGKNPAWPPKAGIRTPGIQVPFEKLKSEAEITLEGAASAALVDGGNLVLAVPSLNQLARLDTKTNKAIEPWKDIHQPCGALASAFGGLWTANCGKNTLSRIDTKKGTVAKTIDLTVANASPAFAANADSLWVLTDAKTTLARVDGKEGNVVAELRLPANCNAIAYEADAIWVLSPSDNRILRIEPKTNLVDKRVEVAADPVAMVFAEAHLWVLGAKEGKISKLDPKTNKVVATIETGIPATATSIAFGDGHLWVGAGGYPLTKISPQTDKVVRQFAGEGAGTVRFAANSLWIMNNTKITRIDPKRVALTLPD